ncbi:unnamed protein product [Cylindrotheca closterium]|uniref:Helicase-associated domain-containing protein n=1 Tax=Cylindrotheca closterium TaxID=2856 RepID=A0AAD2CTB2_9STRA|nr:unnamed protein product [Cylindrotheca closterium]
MHVHEGATDLSVDSATNEGSPRVQVITQSQSSPTKRKRSPNHDSEDDSSALSKSTRKKLKKERKSAKKARKEKQRRERDERRMEKESKKKEKRQLKALKKRGRSTSADQREEESTNQESAPIEEDAASNDPGVASKPTKKRKITEIERLKANTADRSHERGSSVNNPGSPENDEQTISEDDANPGYHNDASVHAAARDSHDGIAELYPSTDDDEDANEEIEKNEETAPRPRRKERTQERERRKGRSQMSVSNRYSPRTWNERLEALINFKLEHGHTNVPSRNFHDRGLAEFVVQLKNNSDELNVEQKDALCDLGFDWTTGQEKKERAWDENLDRLDKFHKEHNNFAVHKFAEFKKLHGWLIWQRNLQLHGRLREDRKERLEGIGYTDWAAKKTKKNASRIPNTWMRQYKNLQVYVRENGHSMVPQHKHTDNHEDRTLSNWVRKQRTLRNKNCLSAEKMALLEKLNFVWTFDTSNKTLRSGKLIDQRKEFDISLDLLRKYKEENGSIEDVRGDMMIGDRNVGKWLAKQKSLGRRGLLINDRMVRLEQELGLIFA